MQDFSQKIRLKVGSKILNQEKYRTGISDLDVLLNGGIPKGKVLGLYDLTSSTGKTILSLQICGNLIRQGETVLYISLDQDINRFMLKKYKVPLENFFLSKFLPSSKDILSLPLSVLIIDSTTSIIQEEDTYIPIRKFFREVTSNRITSILSINQSRVYSGKHSLAGKYTIEDCFYTSLFLENLNLIKDKLDVVGRFVRISVKSKEFPFEKREIIKKMLFNEGFI